MKEPQEILIPYKKLLDETLSVEGQEYVRGYEAYCRGNSYFHVEHRIEPDVDCPEKKRGCRAKWVGYLFGNFGCGKVKALYRCKHGDHTYHLVTRIKSF